MTVPIKIAGYAQAQQRVPTNYPWLPGMEHIVQEVRHEQGYVVVKTNEGEWPFLATEPLNFPRRPDGKLREWEPGTGRLRDLCTGDFILSDSSRWMVNRISYGGKEDYIVASAYNGYVTKTFAGYADAPITALFSGPASSTYTRKRKASPRYHYAPLYGPYFFSTEPERLVMFAVHPSGRGRWPSELSDDDKVYEPVPDLTIKRRPTYFHGWHFLGANSFLRHPHDPDWGERGADEAELLARKFDIEAVKKAVEEYNTNGPRDMTEPW